MGHIYESISINTKIRWLKLKSSNDPQVSLLILLWGICSHIQTSKKKLFAKIVGIWKPIIIFTKNFILDVWLYSEYAFVIIIIVDLLYSWSHKRLKTFPKTWIFERTQSNSILFSKNKSNCLGEVMEKET